MISKINPKRMSDQLLMVKRDDCTWGNLIQFDLLHSFDLTLEKACVIAEKKTDSFGRVVQTEEGDEQYFIILEFLQ